MPHARASRGSPASNHRSRAQAPRRRRRTPTSVFMPAPTTEPQQPRLRRSDRWDSSTTRRKRPRPSGRKIQDAWEDTTDRIGDKVDEAKADANVKKAEAERDSVETRNDIKAQICATTTRLNLSRLAGRDSGGGPRRVLRGLLHSRRTRAADPMTRVCGSRGAALSAAASERGDPPGCLRPWPRLEHDQSRVEVVRCGVERVRRAGHRLDREARTVARLGRAAGRSAVWICTHGHAASHDISTPVPAASVTRTVAMPAASRVEAGVGVVDLGGADRARGAEVEALGVVGVDRAQRRSE